MNKRSVAVSLALFAPWACHASRDEAPSGFEIHPDFSLELVASEPVVLDPVDLEFDEQGRVFVLEMPGYPGDEEPVGRVVLLGDEDGDGRYETRTLFAEKLAATADSILSYRGGLLVASPPDLLFLEDTDGDGRADTREVVLSGFSVGNPQHNLNGLNHGLDNWIYGANGGGSGSQVFWPEDPTRTIQIHDNDFRFHIPSRRFERTGATAGGFEMTFDSWGRSFSTHNTEHVSLLVFPGRHLENQPGALRNTRQLISDHGTDGPARIFPIGAQETRVNHPEQSGHFSGACGITAYTGGVFGADFADNLFIADVVLNLVHRAVVVPDGSSLLASRARERVEFIASRDRSFRPVNMTVGPDGALYLLDMHRDVIEHPEWIPDEIEATLDLDAGKDEGRLYRITPRAGLPRLRPERDRACPAKLVEALGHPNKWWRDTAQRLLVESESTSVAPALREALSSSDDPHERLHALWTLEGLGLLESDDLAAALADTHPRLRENALVVAEQRVGDDPALMDAVARLVDDPDARVRMFVALALGSLDDERARDALLTVAARDAADRWTRAALLSGLDRDPLAAVRGILERPSISEADGGMLVRHLSARVPGPGVDGLLVALAKPDTPAPVVAAALAGLANGLDDGGRKTQVALSPTSERWIRSLVVDAPDTLASAAGQAGQALGLAPTREETARLRRACGDALDPERAVDERLEALGLCELAPFDQRSDILFALLETTQPASLQLAAFHQLAQSRDETVAPHLLAKWKELGRDVRGEAGTFLLRRRANHGALLTALEDEVVTLGELNLDLERRRRLLRSPDESVRERASALFSDAGVVTRAEALAAMRPALELEGDATAGRAVFAELCARCHRMDGEGTELGPDLTDISRKSAETVLREIVDPNAAVEATFVGYSVELGDGRILSGILINETDDRLTVREAGGLDTEVLRKDIESLWTGGLSTMPEELEVGLELQAMADLLAYLQQPR